MPRIETSLTVSRNDGRWIRIGEQGWEAHHEDSHRIMNALHRMKLPYHPFSVRLYGAGGENGLHHLELLAGPKHHIPSLLTQLQKSVESALAVLPFISQVQVGFWPDWVWGGRLREENGTTFRLWRAPIEFYLESWLRRGKDSDRRFERADFDRFCQVFPSTAIVTGVDQPVRVERLQLGSLRYLDFWMPAVASPLTAIDGLKTVLFTAMEEAFGEKVSGSVGYRNLTMWSRWYDAGRR